MTNESILIIGTGALATLFAARLSATKVSVTMLGTWPEGLEALKHNGAKVDGEDRAFKVYATNNPSKCKGIRFAFVLVKAWQTERVARQLKTCLPENGFAITLQNGLGNDSILENILGSQRVVQGVTTLGATLISPGIVHLGGEGPVSLEAHPELLSLVKMVRHAGFTIDVEDNVSSLVWSKLVISSAINPLTALLRVKNGELLKNQFSLEMLRTLAREAAMVAKKLGIILPFTNPERAAEDVAQQTAENQSSMLQDVLRGATTEIDAINGAIVRLAEQNNLLVPVNRAVWSLVKALPVRGKIKI